MKVYVRYNQSKKSSTYLASRYRKNIKGSLELNGVRLVDSLTASPDIVHLLSPEDELFALKAKDSGAKVVTSAFYCEAETPLSFLGEEEEDGYRPLKAKALRLLKNSDLIFVPDAKGKGIIFDEGLSHKKVEILLPGVNSARFVLLDQQEESVYQQYFNIRKDEKIIVVFGDYKETKKLEFLNSLALKMRDFRFIFLGFSKKHQSTWHYRRWIKKGIGNVFLESSLPDDVYRSLLHSATLVLYLREPDTITTLEAFACNLPIFIYKEYSQSFYLKKDKNCFVFYEEKELIQAMQNGGKEKSLLVKNYTKDARMSYSLEQIGKKYVEFYHALLGEK